MTWTCHQFWCDFIHFKSRTEHPQRNSTWTNLHLISCSCQRKSVLLSDPLPSGGLSCDRSGWPCCSNLFSYSQLHIHDTELQELMIQQLLWAMFFPSIKTICFLEPKSSSNLICRFALSLLISPHKTTQENSIVLLNSLGCSHANVSQQSASPKLLFQLKYLGKCWIDCHKIWYRQPRCPGVESDFCWLWWSNFFLLASSWCQGIELYIFSCPANISVSTWCIGRKFGSLRLHPNDSGVTEV